MTPRIPPKRDAKCCCGVGTVPGAGGCATSSCVVASSTRSSVFSGPRWSVMFPLPAPAEPAPALLVRLRRAYASCRLLPAPSAGHREAELFLGGGRRELAHDAA